MGDHLIVECEFNMCLESVNHCLKNAYLSAVPNNTIIHTRSIPTYWRRPTVGRWGVVVWLFRVGHVG